MGISNKMVVDDSGDIGTVSDDKVIGISTG